MSSGSIQLDGIYQATKSTEIITGEHHLWIPKNGVAMWTEEDGHWWPNTLTHFDPLWAMEWSSPKKGPWMSHRWLLGVRTIPLANSYPVPMAMILDVSQCKEGNALRFRSSKFPGNAVYSVLFNLWCSCTSMAILGVFAMTPLGTGTGHSGCCWSDTSAQWGTHGTRWAGMDQSFQLEKIHLILGGS